MKIIGVDVGGTSIKIGIFEEDAILTEKWEIQTRTQNNGELIVTDIVNSVKAKLEEKVIPMREIKGIGIGIPGPVTGDGEVEVCVNLGWRDKKLGKELNKLLGIPVKVGNDGNVAALGEAWQGAGKGRKNIVVITLGTGIGAGIIIDEKIVSGVHGLSGEIGHMHVNNAEEEICNCKGKGCLEQYSSATGIVRQAKHLLENSNISSILRQYGEEISAKDILDAAKMGDSMAVEIAECAGRYLGMAFANTSLLIDPEAFIIGGGVSKVGKYLIDIIEKHYRGYLKLSEKKAEICPAMLGNDAGIYGAAKMVL